MEVEIRCARTIVKVISVSIAAAGLAVGAPLAAAAPPDQPSQVAEEKWRPLPHFYGNVNDPDSGLQFPYGAILSVSQTRDLYRSGVLPTVAGMNIRPGDASEIARVLRQTIEEQRLVTENGCVLVMYSPSPMYNPKKREMTHWAGKWYRGLGVCTP